MTAPPRTHPSTFLFLVIPFGMVTGYPVVTLAFLLAKNHVGLESIATISAAMYVPNLWKFLWAPVIDLTLTTRKWLFIGSIATAAGILAMSVIPMTASDLWLIGLVVVAANVGGTILSMTTTKLMACATTDEEKGRAGGWFNAGVTSGFGIGGGIGLLLAQHLPTPWMGGTILAMIGLGCGAPILFIQELPRMKIQGVFRGIASVCGEVWALSRARMGFLAIFLCLLPIGSGAAQNLWAAVAGDWQASEGTVALVTGVLGGLLMAVGCIVGGWICDRMDRKAAYVAFAVLLAACAIAMALSPHTEWMYIIWTAVYAFITGLVCAGLTAFILEAIGSGAAATKYNVLGSLSNLPVMLMTRFEGQAHSRWGASGMLYFEAIAGILGLILFLGCTQAVRRWWPVHWPHSVPKEFEPLAFPDPLPID